MARLRNIYRAVHPLFGPDTNVTISLETTTAFERTDRADSPWVLGSILQLKSLGFRGIKFTGSSLVVNPWGTEDPYQPKHLKTKNS